jgi:hypothetical protein
VFGRLSLRVSVAIADIVNVSWFSSFTQANTLPELFLEISHTHFRSHPSIHPALKMETVCFSETLVSTYKSTRRYNPEEQHRHLHRRWEPQISHFLPNSPSVTILPFCDSALNNPKKPRSLCCSRLVGRVFRLHGLCSVELLTECKRLIVHDVRSCR